MIFVCCQQVIDHYENPRNVGKLDAKKKNVGTGLVGAPACGDVMRLQIEVGQCSGSGSKGSTCFWASRIRIWILLLSCKNSKKTISAYCSVTSFGLFIFEK